MVIMTDGLLNRGLAERGRAFLLEEKFILKTKDID